MYALKTEEDWKAVATMATRSFHEAREQQERERNMRLKEAVSTIVNAIFIPVGEGEAKQ